MGILNLLFGQTQPQARIPNVPSILPQVVIDEIKNDRLPRINADKLFLTRGEVCHYADQALLIYRKTTRKVSTTNYGRSVPGLMKGNRWHVGNSVSEIEENIEQSSHKGILYITNKRIVFTSKEHSFDKQFRYLSSVEPYKNAIELQYGSNVFELFVPDGEIVYRVIKLIQ